MHHLLNKQLEFIRSKTDFVPDFALVLGSGLGGFAHQIKTVCEISYANIDGMPVSTAPSHDGKFIFGTIDNQKVIAMQGRVHLYEGYTAQEVVLPIRLMHLLGAKTLILTNAAGGINKHYHPGDFMLMTDHISAFVPSPLVGKNDDSLGVRFPNMSCAYNRELQMKAKRIAAAKNIRLHAGVYAQLVGPQFESPAEIKMLSTLGADAVGMSTVIEAIAAVHCGMNVCGISVITNYASGICDQPQSEEEVTETAERVAADFETLLKGMICE